MLLTAAGAFIGALLSLFFSILIENQRKPKLKILWDEPSSQDHMENLPAKKMKLLRVHVVNAKLHRCFGWMKRDVAMHCTAEIQVFHMSNLTPLFQPPVSARWPRADEPLSLQMISTTGHFLSYFDISKYNAAFTRNIYPDSEEPIDTFVRFDSEEDCYIWNNDTYQHENWRNPDAKIPRGSYYVIVTVFSSGEITKGYYQLENSISLKNFRLIDLSRDEINKLRNL